MEGLLLPYKVDLRLDPVPVGNILKLGQKSTVFFPHSGLKSAAGHSLCGGPSSRPKLG